MQLTYTQLTQAIEDLCETTETIFVNNIDNFITAAESRIYNAANLPVLRQNVTGALTVGNPYLACPSGWLATYSLAIAPPGGGAYTYLLDKDVNFIRECYPNSATLGQPAHYAQFDDDTFIVGPSPDQAYFVELHYKAYPDSITVTTTGQTWLGDNFADVLLYGSVWEAYIFQKGDPDMMENYSKKYQESLGLMKMLVDGANRMDTYRSGQLRIPQQ